MSAPIDHKKPTVAFVLLFVLVSAILGNGLRARADGTALAFAVPTTIEASAPAPAARAGRPSSDAAALAGALTGTGATTPAATDGSRRHETRAAVHPHRHARPATRSPARGPLGHGGTSVGGVRGAHGVPRVAVHPGTGSPGSVTSGLHRPTPRATGVPAGVSARSGGVTARVVPGGLRARVPLAFHAPAGRR